jgi:lipopolysaccharide transport system permease protein
MLRRPGTPWPSARWSVTVLAGGVVAAAWALLQPCVIPEQWRLLYALNPMVGVIDGFRWAILGGEAHLYWPGFLLSWGLIAGFLWLGIRQFRNMEKGFADFI